MLVKAKPNCPLHNLPLLYICCMGSCTSPLTVCKFCETFHSQHQQKLIKYENLLLFLSSHIQRQNNLEVEVFKQNDILSKQLIEFRKIFDDRQRSLISLLMKKFEEQKSTILQKYRADKQKQQDKTIRYFDKLSQKGLLQYRMMFSSKQGLQYFYRAYRQYCQYSDISCHLKQEILPQVQEEDELVLEEKIRKQFSGTLMKTVMNYIKLKISKRDMMRVTTIAKDTTSVIKQPPPPPPPPQPQPQPRNIGLPPLSPTRKVKIGKTEVNIVFHHNKAQS